MWYRAFAAFCILVLEMLLVLLLYWKFGERHNVVARKREGKGMTLVWLVMSLTMLCLWCLGQSLWPHPEATVHFFPNRQRKGHGMELDNHFLASPILYTRKTVILTFSEDAAPLFPELKLWSYAALLQHTILLPPWILDALMIIQLVTNLLSKHHTLCVPYVLNQEVIRSQAISIPWYNEGIWARLLVWR